MYASDNDTVVREQRRSKAKASAAEVWTVLDGMHRGKAIGLLSTFRSCGCLMPSCGHGRGDTDPMPCLPMLYSTDAAALQIEEIAFVLYGT